MLKNSFFVIFGKALSGLFTFLLGIFIARFYGAHLSGLFFLSLTIFNILSIISKVGLDSGVLKYISVYNSQKKFDYVKGTIIDSVILVSVISIILGTFLFLFSDKIAFNIFKKSDLSEFLKILAIFLPFYSTWGIFIESLRGLKSFKLLTINQNIIFPLGNIITLIFVYTFAGKSSGPLVVSYGVSVVLWGVAPVAISLYKFFPEVFFATRKSDLVEIIKFSWPLIFVAIISTFIYWIDIIMIGVMRSPEDVGIFSAASKTSLLVVFVLVSIGNIASPYISEYYHQKKLHDLETFSQNCASWSFYISLLIAITFIIFSSEIMGIYGSEFKQGATALMFLSAGQTVNAATGLVGQVLIMGNRSRTLGGVYIFCSAINVILNLLLIPRYGITGAALASSITLSTMNIVLIYFVYKLFKIKVYVKRLPSVLLVGIVSIFVFYISKIIISNYFSYIVFVFTYVLLIYHFCVNATDKIYLKKLRENII